jgi:hypothetical protein
MYTDKFWQRINLLNHITQKLQKGLKKKIQLIQWYKKHQKIANIITKLGFLEPNISKPFVQKYHTRVKAWNKEPGAPRPLSFPSTSPIFI